MRVSKDFSDFEFCCGCGCGKDNIGAAVVFILQRIRDHYGVPVTVTSACRCLIYNREVGSNDRSQHPRRTAVDFTVEGVHPHEIYQLIDSWYPDSLGIGRYADFTHVDTRKAKARW